MNKVTEEVLNSNGINIHIVPSKKYKTINIVAKLKASLQRETITKRALLPYILQQGTKSYPSSTELQVKLDELYGAVLSISGAKKGNNHIITIRLEVANHKFIADQSPLFEEALELLNEIIFQPNTKNGAFAESVVGREKETLKQKISAIQDDKMSYANMRLIDEMCEGEAYSLHVHGYEEDLSSITPNNLFTYYQTLINEDQLDLYVLGDFESETMKQKIINHLRRDEASVSSIQEDNLSKKQDEPKVIMEKQSIQQAKLHLGYRTNCTYQDDGYFALQVFNGIFGGFPSSKLFINVREKNSLAYYAASRIESHKGLLLVFSGIAPKDYEKAKEIIELQMASMKNGEFTEDTMNETKELIVNQLLDTMDHPQGLIELLYQQVVGNKKLSPEQLIMNIKQVTKEDVIAIADKIDQDTVYLLTNDGGNSND
ncbi:EF-P 5-aminopentanol modification-associated protein YfmF [Virgibacillus oceani]|uniref:Peptidase M16 n=1 Tax=Virgibacillus oceani TaxID=1479511 RepID=A0A917LZ70_9BACI|nr:pitrilysin family protein [Virgibacillus oceani]GGG68587.1 peptidase M16 [Virgibacillus oceani]